MEKLRNQIYTKKFVGIDVIPHKLVKMASNFLAQMLTTAISSNIKSSMFPENEKVATVVSLDKGKPFPFSGQLVSLNLFSKFYEEIIKDQHVLKYRKLFLAHDIYL